MSQLATGQSEEQRALSKIQTLKARLSKAAPMALSRPLQQATASQTPQQVQWVLASGPAIKLFVQQEGWYRVTQPELVNAGLSKGINPQYLQLYVDGTEQPIRVINHNNRFDSGDAIEFYGTGLDTPFTDTRVYWLVVGSSPGKRIQQVVSSGSRVRRGL